MADPAESLTGGALVAAVARASGCRLTLLEVGVEEQTLSIAGSSPHGDTVYGWLAGLSAEQGLLWRAGAAPVIFADWSEVDRAGVPLRAELVIGDGVSARLRYAGEATWVQTLVVEEPAPSFTGERRAAAAEDIELLSADKRFTTLRYRRYWTVEPDGASRVFAHRYLGATGGPT